MVVEKNQRMDYPTTCEQRRWNFFLNDPLLITFPDEEHSTSEERYISIGTSATNKILLVIHTEREATEETMIIRIISCRKATASERRTYEEGED